MVDLRDSWIDYIAGDLRMEFCEANEFEVEIVELCDWYEHR